MPFEENIKQWVLVDNTIKKLQTQMKQLKEQRSVISEVINEYIETNELTEAQINISDGRLKYHVTRVTQPLTLKYVKDCLAECILDQEKVNRIMDYLKNRREIREVVELKRYYNKQI